MVQTFHAPIESGRVGLGNLDSANGWLELFEPMVGLTETTTIARPARRKVGRLEDENGAIDRIGCVDALRKPFYSFKASQSILSLCESV